jgi:hypothetical protein
VLFTFVEAEVAATVDTGITEPLFLRYCFERWVKAERMKSWESSEAKDQKFLNGTHHNRNRHREALLRHDFSCDKFHSFAVPGRLLAK